MSVSVAQLLATLRAGFVSSCQPVDGGPMDSPEIVAAMAQASIAGGAVAVRIEGIENLKATRQKITAPIIALIKRDLENSDVRITPFVEDVIALAKAGADIIAIDATFRTRPTFVAELVKAIHKAGCVAMADCSSLNEGIESQRLGVEIIGTTMSGYMGNTVPSGPDLELVTAFSHLGYFVMAEGRYNTPELAKQAIVCGAASVTIGSAITRIEHICSWYADAVQSVKVSRGEAVA